MIYASAVLHNFCTTHPFRSDAADLPPDMSDQAWTNFFRNYDAHLCPTCRRTGKAHCIHQTVYRNGAAQVARCRQAPSQTRNEVVVSRCSLTYTYKPRCPSPREQVPNSPSASGPRLPSPSHPRVPPRAPARQTVRGVLAFVRGFWVPICVFVSIWFALRGSPSSTVGLSLASARPRQAQLNERGRIRTG